MTDVQLKQTSAQPLDPNVLQWRAANPAANAWVGASAGAGKTKVLTDRIMRLLLPPMEGAKGAAPHKILALTFTKAAASEMDARLRQRLSDWAVISDDKLSEALHTLLGRTPRPDEIIAARRLFAQVVDAPGGLSIMTIHSFCQSVLGRFPLEAGISPDFTLVEDQEEIRLFTRAWEDFITTCPSGSPEEEALNRLSLALMPEDLLTQVKSIKSEQRQYRDILRQHFGLDGLYTALCNALSIPPGQGAEDILRAACADHQFARESLREVAGALLESGSNDSKKGRFIADWLAAPDDQGRIDSFHLYKSAFLTGKDEAFAAVATAGFLKKFPAAESVLTAERDRILAVLEDCAAAECARLTADLMRVAGAVMTRYNALKAQRGTLDFDDLINTTLRLLSGDTMKADKNKAPGWVMYKLDQGIDHILVDEAQDTNPEQWAIIKALTIDFFSGEGAHENAPPRTLFVVGDDKQSIFSFQRAAPEKFRQMEEFFGQKITAAGEQFDPVDINISFRSAKPVLALVDAVFADPALRQGLGGHVLPHEVWRSGQPGKVELWPLCESDEKPKDDNPFLYATTTQSYMSGPAKLAKQIAGQIDFWLKNKTPLYSHDRPIHAGDIMVLVRRRSAFVGQLVRELKLAGVPVSGVDRMVLKDQLPVMDCLAAARFALLPDDDLSLAELLKSPFIGWSDDDLLTFAPQRPKGQPLWLAFKKTFAGTKEEHYLTGLIESASHMRVYDFFNGLLHHPCPASPVSGLKAMRARLGDDALDPLDEFLNSALSFDMNEGGYVQEFLQLFTEESGDIKRQMDEGGTAVRIMTVHASKGLQAPIVFLPDTTRGQNNVREKLFWPERSSNLSLPYFAASAKMAVREAAIARDIYARQSEEEYARLLYVAMTRAENHLIVCGHKPSRMMAESWYSYVAAGMDGLGAQDEGNGILSYALGKSKEPDRTKKKKEAAGLSDDLPIWATRPPETEPSPPRPLVPSKPAQSDADISAASPLDGISSQRFQRGNITHKLLQIMPDIAPDKRAGAMRRYLAQPGQELSDELQQSIANEVMAILTDKNFAPIFGPGSLAEVPVTGMLDDKTLISGQIDRVLVTDAEIYIIDYKTNRPPPNDVKDVPDIYRKQLAAYARALSKIYPNRTIRTALLWTDGPRLMEISIS